VSHSIRRLLAPATLALLLQLCGFPPAHAQEPPLALLSTERNPIRGASSPPRRAAYSRVRRPFPYQALPTMM
jgi:hypothetical protein